MERNIQPCRAIVGTKRCPNIPGKEYAETGYCGNHQGSAAVKELTKNFRATLMEQIALTKRKRALEQEIHVMLIELSKEREMLYDLVTQREVPTAYLAEIMESYMNGIPEFKFNGVTELEGGMLLEFDDYNSWHDPTIQVII